MSQNTQVVRPSRTRRREPSASEAAVDDAGTSLPAPTDAAGAAGPAAKKTRKYSGPSYSGALKKAWLGPELAKLPAKNMDVVEKKKLFGLQYPTALAREQYEDANCAEETKHLYGDPRTLLSLPRLRDMK